MLIPIAEVIALDNNLLVDDSGASVSADDRVSSEEEWLAICKYRSPPQCLVNFSAHQKTATQKDGGHKLIYQSIRNCNCCS
jgi:hypothetical protein